ncbi:MAG: hypothetical protein DRJ20_02245, partial [Candidatus Methanomethylicota archaeon]
MPFNVMKESITIKLPENPHIRVIKPKPVETKNVKSEVKKALRSSYIKKLMDKIRNGTKVAVLIDDHTRPTPTRE